MHPILYEIPTPWGRVAIFSYGVCMALAALVGWYAWARRDVARARLFASAWIGALIGGKLDWAASYGDGIFEGGLTVSGLVAGAAFASWIRGGPWRSGVTCLTASAAAHALGQWLHGAGFHPLGLYEAFCALVLTVATWRQPSRAALWTALLLATHVALEPLRPTQTAVAYVLPTLTIGMLVAIWMRGGTISARDPDDE